MDNLQKARNNRELLRAKVKMNLRLPRVIGLKKLPEEILAPKDKEVKLDRRYFHNVFTLQEKLGEGANGYVHRCTEVKTGLVYAVKVLAGDEEFVRIVKQTYQILKFYDHESIIRAKCCFIDENTQQIYLVMEYCQYPALSKTMEQRHLTAQEKKAIVTSLLQAVNLVHQESVCHRDIKPDNVLYDAATNKIKIIDFGISKCTFNKRTQENDAMWTVTGTQYYKAPEMLNGSAYDQKVDVWAIGVIAYQLIFGHLPFYSEYVSETIDQILSEEPNYSAPNITALDIDFMKALLKKDPTVRLSCAEALRHPWIQHHNRCKKSDQLSSSSFLLPRQQATPRRCSPTICIQTPNRHINVIDLQMQEDIIEVSKEIVMGDWLGLGKRSCQLLYPSSVSGSEMDSQADSEDFEMREVEE